MILLSIMLFFRYNFYLTGLSSLTTLRVFRKLYNIRASITNSSMMDLVLEDIMNTIFYFIMACIVMAVLNFNPWGLLLSMTSVIVSFAFALGPSVSKYIEGIMLIAFRR